MKDRLLFLFRLYITLLLLFATQKVVFMIFNSGYAAGVPLGSCLAVLWHGVRLDSVTASYILVVPVIIVFISCFCDKFPLRRVLLPFWWIVASLMSIVFIADTIVYFFWGAKMDTNDLIYAAKPKDMLASLRWWSIIVAFLIVAVLVWHYWRRMRHTTPTMLATVRNHWWSLLFLPIAGLLFVGMRGGVSESTANPSYAYFSKYAFCNHAALNPLFNILHSVAKTEDLEREFALYDENKVEQIIGPYFENDPSVSDTLLRMQRPDILMIVWESGGWDMVMNDTVGPNIIRLAEEGICFSDCYANNFRTDRGLVSLLSGWMGLPTTSLMKMSDRCRRLPGLAQTLQYEGYSTSFVYGGDVDFTNMRGYLHETGFENVCGFEAFPSSKKKSSWGAPDAYTLLPSVIDYKNDKTSKKRFDVILTLSSHEPWSVEMHRFNDDRKNSFAYTDSCIGVLVDSLRLMPMWDSLLVIIVPDHGVPLSNTQSTSDWTVSHVPIVWTGGAIKCHKTIDKTMMQSDLAATLLAQMGIDASDFIMSRNATSPTFAEKSRWALHCFKNGCNLIDSTGAVRYECNREKNYSGEDAFSDRITFVEMLLQYVYQRTARI